MASDWDPSALFADALFMVAQPSVNDSSQTPSDHGQQASSSTRPPKSAPKKKVALESASKSVAKKSSGSHVPRKSSPLVKSSKKKHRQKKSVSNRRSKSKLKYEEAYEEEVNEENSEGDAMALSMSRILLPLTMAALQRYNLQDGAIPLSEFAAKILAKYVEAVLFETKESSSDIDEDGNSIEKEINDIEVKGDDSEEKSNDSEVESDDSEVKTDNEVLGKENRKRTRTLTTPGVSSSPDDIQYRHSRRRLSTRHRSEESSDGEYTH